MLFNSYAFIFLFLPAVLLGTFALGRLDHLAAVVWLALASLAFYAFGNWQFVPLLVASIAFNYAIGYLLIERKLQPAARRAALITGVGGDLLILGIFKYGGFFAANLNSLFGTSLTVAILLPVGISFYTFTQIAFLVDAYRGNVARYALPHYALFVTYFPHLIAGPILHHRDMIPQFERKEIRRPDAHLILCGTIIFAIGLFKKTCLADGIQPLVALAFGATAPLSFDRAWIGALAYTYQLYFDFSGYSDMAIGISLMFGVFLPLNFASPYKANSIIDFWRRWHMTLSKFLRDYLYIPLGGNRRGRVLRYVNLMITMLLGGLWHGAAWTFVAWGALHGIYLCINHAWNHFVPPPPRFALAAKFVGGALTFLAVVVAWVFFRADSFASALTVLSGMANPATVIFGRDEVTNILFIAVYAAIVWLAPNTQTLMRYDHERRTVGAGEIERRSLPLYAAAAALAFGILGIQQHSEFIYFRF